MADIRITPGSSTMAFTSSLNFTETLIQDPSGSVVLRGSGSLNRTNLFAVDGNNGRLFSVDDDLSDSLFSVNTIAGLPVIEAFANNTVKIGQYGKENIIVSGSTTTISGSFTVGGTTSFSGNASWFGGYGAGSGPGLAFENQTTFARIVFFGLDFYEWDYGLVGGINNGYIYSNTSFRAPIFYDSDDTGYYVNPNSTSNLVKIIAGGVGNSTYNTIGSNVGATAIAWNNAQLELRCSDGGNVGLAFHRAGYTATSLYHTGNGLYTADILQSATDMRAPVFYDSNDTGYYVDPNGTSILSYVQTNNYIQNMGPLYQRGNVLILNAPQNGWHTILDRNGGDPITYGINSVRGPIFYDSNDTAYYLNPADADVAAVLKGTVTIGGGTGGNYDEGIRIIDSNSFSVIAFGASGNAGPGRYQWLKNSSDVFELRKSDGTQIWWANQSGDVGINYIGYAGSSFRAPIFYDSNNTGYYVDPASTSNMNVITLAGYIISGTPQGLASGTKDTHNYSSFRAAGVTISQADDTFYPIVTGYSQITGQGYYNAPSFGFIRGTANINGDAVISNRGDGLGTLYWRFKYDGSFVAPGDIVAYSDARLKENVEDITDAISKIKAIRGVTFTRNDACEGEENTRHMGVIAQELLEVVPEVVKGTEDTNYSVAYGNLAGLFIEAIKEQQTQIDELKQLVKQLTQK